MRRGVLGFGLLLALVMLAACSSKVDDYRREANAICAAAEKRLGETPKPSTPAELAKVTEREIAVRGDALTELSELTVPKDIEAATAVVADLELRQEHARAIKKAAEGNQMSKLRKLRRQESEEHELAASRAEEIGLADCAEL